MKLAALCSGGKDSTFALWLAMRDGHEVTKIVSMIPAREDSYMYHFPNIKLVDLFAECVGLPLVKAGTGGTPEEEVEELKRVLVGLGVEGVVSGAIASSYQKSRIDGVCRELGLEPVAPLWGRDPLHLLHEMLAAGMRVIVTGVAADGLDEGWLGRELDGRAVEELRRLGERYGINLSGEGGEYETLVLDAPFFRSRIVVLDAVKIWRGAGGYFFVKSAAVEKK